MPNSDVINLRECFEKFSDTFSPKVIAELNGQHVKVVRCEGDKIPWHSHREEDEMFLVLEGCLEILERDETYVLNPLELYVVKKGVEHRIRTQGPVKILLFEPAGILHTGDVKSDVTQTETQFLD